MVTEQSDKRNKRDIFGKSVQAFLSAWAMLLVTGMSVRNLYSGIVFIMFLLLYRHVDQKGNKRSRIICVMAAFLTVLVIMAEHQKITEAFSSRLFQLLILLIAAAGLYITVEYILRYLNGILTAEQTYDRIIGRNAQSVKWIPFWGYALICFLLWVPSFLYEYPGIMSPDSMNQFYQVIGAQPLSNHHPVVHTLLIGLCYHVGRWFTQDVSAALSCYTIVQMSFMACCAAYVIRTLEECYGIRHRISILILAFYALMPYQGVFAVTIWKDVPFAGIMMLTGCILLRMLCTEQRRLWIGLYLTGCAMSLFRSNGWYVFVLLIPFLLYVFRRSIGKMLLCCTMVVLTVSLIKGPVMRTVGIEQPDFIESCSIPLQQITRVIVDGKYLTPEQDELIRHVIDTTYIKQLYATDFADNMKELVRAGDQNYLVQHKEAYAILWLQLGIRYPGTYLQSWVDMTKGFWYPDVYQNPGNIDGVIPNQAGVSATPLIGGPIVIKGKEILLKLGGWIPLYGLLWSIGSYFWAMMLVLTIVLGQNTDRKRILVIVPQLLLLLTLFIAAPVADFRYAYAVVETLPLWGMMALHPATGRGSLRLSEEVE